MSNPQQQPPYSYAPPPQPPQQQGQQPYYGQPQQQQPPQQPYYGGQQPMPPNTNNNNNNNNNALPPAHQPQAPAQSQQSNARSNNTPSTNTTAVANVSRQRLMRPPFVDPQTNIIYDVDNPEYEGWLTKQSMWLKEWRRRYCILKGSKLFFGRNEYQAPHDMVDLALCTTVKSADLKSKKRHSFEISTAETCFLLYADTESEKDDWIGRVGKAIVRCSRTYYQQGSDNVNNGTNNRSGGGNSGGQGQGQQREDEDSDDDDIYTNDDPNNPYYND